MPVEAARLDIQIPAVDHRLDGEQPVPLLEQGRFAKRQGFAAGGRIGVLHSAVKNLLARPVGDDRDIDRLSAAEVIVAGGAFHFGFGNAVGGRLPQQGAEIGIGEQAAFLHSGGVEGARVESGWRNGWGSG